MDGTVTDNCTGLMWQQETANRNGDEVIDFGDRFPSFSASCAAFNYAEGLVLTTTGEFEKEGDVLPEDVKYDDWRLANIRELQSIVDYGRINPAIDESVSARSGKTRRLITGRPRSAQSTLASGGRSSSTEAKRLIVRGSGPLYEPFAAHHDSSDALCYLISFLGARLHFGRSPECARSSNKRPGIRTREKMRPWLSY